MHCHPVSTALPCALASAAFPGECRILPNLVAGRDLSTRADALALAPLLLLPRGPQAFNICGDCMLAPWSAWVSQKNKLLGGDSIVFSDVLHLGSIDAGDWTNPNDREGVLQQLDHHRRLGDIPWRATTSRWLRLHVGGLELVTDLSLGPEDVPEPGQPFRIYTGMKLDEIMTITCVTTQDPPSLGSTCCPHWVSCPCLRHFPESVTTVKDAFMHTALGS